MWSEADYLNLMHRGWAGGQIDGTICGKGSTLENTTAVRARLPTLVRDYDIHTVCDAGAGDMHWVKTLEWDVRYTPFDLVPRDRAVMALDIRKESLPVCDLILCRLVLGHMSPSDVQNSLALFKLSGRYLLATHHAEGQPRLDHLSSFNRWNLSVTPFELGDPLESIPDVSGRYLLSLWRLA